MGERLSEEIELAREREEQKRNMRDDARGITGKIEDGEEKSTRSSYKQ